MSDTALQHTVPSLASVEAAREVAARIDEQRNRLRRTALGTGFALAVTAFCAWLAAETAADFLTNHSWPVRLACLVAGLGLALGLVCWFGVRPWRRRIADETMALMIERAAPVFRSRFIAAVQLAKEPPATTSPALVRALLAETTALAATADFAPVVDTRPLRRLWIIATLALLLSAALALIGGSRTWPLVRRAFLGKNPVPRQTLLLEIRAPRLLAVGEDWRVSVTAGGIVPESGRLLIRSASGRRQIYELPPDGAPPVFERMLQSVQESFTAVIALGDAESDPVAVRVQARPAVAGVECRQTFPAYTKLPRQRRALGDLKILAGSRLALKVKTSAPVKSGELRLLGIERETVVKRVSLAIEGPDATQLAGDVEIPAQGATGLTLHLVDLDGVESRGAAVYPLEILQDQAPTLKLLRPERREELLTREATMLLAFEAQDDFGVDKVRLHYAVDWVEGAPHKTIDLDLGGVAPKELSRRFHWRLGQIVPHVEEGSVIDYWIEALDANDVTGPGTVKLEHHQARIVSETEKRADLANRLSDTMEGLNGVRQGQEELNRRLGEMIFEKPPDAKQP